MASKNKKYQKLLTPKTGAPIYDDRGNIVGFEGLDPFSPKPSKAGETYQNSSFGRAVNGWMSQYDTYKPPLQFMPQNQREIMYEDGSSEFMPPPTRDLYSPPPPQAQQEERPKPQFKRKYTAQYAPPEEQIPTAKRGVSQQTSDKTKGIVPAGVKNAVINVPSSWKSFVESAKKVAQESGFPLSVILGQAALETGRTSSPGNNYFGIKGSGNAGTQALATQEATPGGEFYGTTSNFARYNTPEDSARAYVDLIKRNYPQAYAQRSNPTAMVSAIKAGGYATDPNYVAKVTGTPEFQQYQKVPTPPIRPALAAKPAQVKPSPKPIPTPKPTAQPKPVAKKAATKSQPNAFQNAVGGIRKFLGI